MECQGLIATLLEVQAEREAVAIEIEQYVPDSVLRELEDKALKRIADSEMKLKAGLVSNIIWDLQRFRAALAIPDKPSTLPDTSAGLPDSATAPAGGES